MPGRRVRSRRRPKEHLLAEFNGFPETITPFLADLGRNNNKAWFQAHRTDYERSYLEPAKAFVVAAGKALRRVQPGIVAEPRVNGSIFRINRDVRFSVDKRPYKDYLDLWFWEGERKTAVSGFSLRLTAQSLGLGAGARRFDRERLVEYRDAVMDPKAGPALKRAATTCRKTGWPVAGERYRRTPAGYQASGETERLLRFDGLWTGKDENVSEALYGPNFVEFAVERWRESLPIHRWLVRYLG